MKGYYTGRRDQFDVNYTIFSRAVEETNSKEDFIKYLEKKYEYVIERIADQKAMELMGNLELI